MFLPLNEIDPVLKEEVETQGPLSLLHKSMIDKVQVLVSLRNNKKLIGTIIYFDRHYNMIIRNATEHYVTKSKNRGTKAKEGKNGRRELSTLLVRGDNVVLVARKKSAS